MTPKQLNTLIATAALRGVAVSTCPGLGGVKRLTVSRGGGASINYLSLSGDKLLRLSGCESPRHDPLPAMRWASVCEDLANQFEALV
jgi:hypothetical protein